MTRVKSISFTEEYTAEYEYFMKQANKSRYICELIRVDMQKISKIDEDYILRLIEEKLKTSSTTNISGEEDEIRDLLSDFF